MKAYLLTTAVIFGVFSVLHVYELANYWRAPTSDPIFVISVGLIMLLTGGLCGWAISLLKKVQPS